jgi:RNA:NAD 2'-phosphotransferase (TPT1/KptA family)
VKYDAKTGQAVSQSAPLIIKGGVAPGKRNQVAVGTRVATAQEVQLYKVVVEAAEVAQ